MVYADTAKWSDLQVEVKNWITDNRNNGISVSRKIIFRQEEGWLNMESQNLLGSFLAVTDLWWATDCGTVNLPRNLKSVKASDCA